MLKHKIKIILLSLFAIGTVFTAGTTYAWFFDRFFSTTNNEANLGAPTQIYQKTILPITDSLYQLGTSTRRWKEAFFDFASTTNFTIDGISGSTQCLQVDASGNVSGTGTACGAGGGGGGSGVGWTWDSTDGLIYRSTTTEATVLGGTATTSNVLLEVVGGDSLFGGIVTATGKLASSLFVEAPYFSATSETEISNFYDAIFRIATSTGKMSSYSFMEAPYFNATSTTATSTFSNFIQTNGILIPEVASMITPPADNISLQSEDLNGISVLHTVDSSGFMGQVNRDSYFEARNTSGDSIPKGSAVYISDATGGTPNIALAKADSLDTLKGLVGIAGETIADNGFGRVFLMGVIENIDTSSFSVADSLYVSTSTAGAFTSVKPLSPPYYSKKMGTVLVSGVGNGKIEIRAQATFGDEDGTNNTFTAPNFIANSSSVASTFPYASTTALTVSGNSYLGTVSSGVWNGTAIDDAYLTKTGDWTGTFDGQEGSYYLSRSNHTGSQGVSTISNYDWTFGTTYGSNNITASTSIPLWVKGQLNASSTSVFQGLSTFGSGINVNGETITDLTGNGLLNSTGALTCNTSSGSVFGCLSSADWTTFNNKLTSTLTDSYIFVGNGSNVATGVALSGDASLSNTGVLGVNKTRLNIRNETGSTIASTRAVYVSGFNNLPLVSLADNTVESQHNVVCITIAPINNEANGFCAVSGQFDAETNAWNVGTELYLTTSGVLSSTAPTSGGVRHVGIVTVKANYPTGKILAYGTFEENYVAGGTGDNIILRTGDSVGVNKFSFRNYANTEVASINSYGDAIFRIATSTGKLSSYSFVEAPYFSATSTIAVSNFYDTTFRIATSTGKLSSYSFVESPYFSATSTTAVSNFYDTIFRIATSTGKLSSYSFMEAPYFNATSTTEVSNFYDTIFRIATSTGKLSSYSFMEAPYFSATSTTEVSNFNDTIFRIATSTGKLSSYSFVEAPYFSATSTTAVSNFNDIIFSIATSTGKLSSYSFVEAPYFSATSTTAISNFYDTILRTATTTGKLSSYSSVEAPYFNATSTTVVSNFYDAILRIATTTGKLSSYSFMQAPYFNATSTTATSNFAGNVVVGTSLQIPSNDTLSTNGEITIDDTTGQLRTYADGAEKVFVPFSAIVSSMASSTWGTGTTTLSLAPALGAITVVGAYCETSAGTLNVSLYDGTNRADMIQASTTKNYFAFTSNNTFTAGESMRVDIGTAASSPTWLGCRFKYTYTAD